MITGIIDILIKIQVCHKPKKKLQKCKKMSCSVISKDAAV